MTKSSLVVIVILAVLAVLSGYNYFFQPFADFDFFDATQVQPTPSPQVSPSPPVVEDPSLELIEDMTLEQKVWQVIAPAVTVSGDSVRMGTVENEPLFEWVASKQPGLVSVFGQAISRQQAQQVVESLTEYQPASPSAETNDDLEVPIWIGVDHEGGQVQRLSGEEFAVLPSWQAQCELSLADFQSQLSASLDEVAEAGFGVVYAPVLDLAVPGSFLGNRACSSDPALVFERASLYNQLARQRGILPVVKHFPGIGQATVDLHTGFDEVTVTNSDASLYRRILADSGDPAVMTSHAGVVNQDPEVPCSLSQNCVGQLVQNYPDTLIISDDLLMDSVYGASQLPQSLPIIAEQALRSGNDILLFGMGVSTADLEEVHQHMVRAVRFDPTLADQLDRSVAKILQHKQELEVERSQEEE